MDINQFLCFALYSTSRSMTQLYRKYLGEYDLTYPQLMVLVVLWSDDKQTINEIGAKLYLETGTLTPLLKRLEKKGFINRIRSKDDERIVIVSLSKEGKKFKKKLGPLASTMLCDLSMQPDEVQKLVSKIHSVRKNIAISLKS